MIVQRRKSKFIVNITLGNNATPSRDWTHFVGLSGLYPFWHWLHVCGSVFELQVLQNGILQPAGVVFLQFPSSAGM